MHVANGFGLAPATKRLRAELLKQGFDKAGLIAADLKKKNAGFKLDENELNGWGYQLLADKKHTEALAIFKLNVSLNPNSSNTYDSLAEVQDMTGDTISALKNYKRVVELNPGNKNAATQVKRLQGSK